jgi:hypothetical protein
MARVPTIAEEDAKRPNRERDCLVGERTRIVNNRTFSGRGNDRDHNSLFGADRQFGANP